MGERDFCSMKIASVVITGRDGQRVELDAPVVMYCTIGSCLRHGSDEGIVARCPTCKRWTCALHWDEAAALCDECEARRKMKLPRT